MRPIATADLETDPFEYDRVVNPFAYGFYDGKTVTTIWDEQNVIVRSVTQIKALSKPHIIYFHNGGRFDIFYYLEHLGADLRIVNGRIIQCYIGDHEIRDSFAIMPFPLAAYRKDDIDYQKMHKSVRSKHKDEILHYLSGDVIYLHELVTRFHQEFGDSLTIGSTSMRELRKLAPFKRGGESFDRKFRSQFYFGGRCQTFKSGILKGSWKVFDVNSMYPRVMSSMLHPICVHSEVSKRITPNTCFVIAEGRNYGAFPVRTKTGLDFTVPYGRFACTIHEWNAAEDTRRFQCNKIIKTYSFEERGTFDTFVTHFYESRAAAKKVNDKILDLFYKFVLNSAYGKFAQNPANYYEWKICLLGERPEPWHECSDTCRESHPDDLECPLEWVPAARYQGIYWLWKRHINIKRYFNVTTGASITGAARAILLRGLVAADTPLYCDTDSIICKDLQGVPISDTELGAWKLESTGTLATIAGKKLYALFDGNVCTCKDALRCGDPKKKPASCTCVKKANKGSRLTGREILSIARGETVTYRNPVPTFKMDGSRNYITRQIRRTV